MWTAPSTARASSCRPTCSAPSRCSKRRARTGAALEGDAKSGVSLPARLHRRGVRLARPDRAGLHRDARLRAQQPVLGDQGRQRPSRARLPPHLRPAGADDQLLEQLRPLPVSRKADPADDRQRAGRQAAAGVRRRHAGPRLALRGRPLQRHPRACSKGGSGEIYNIGGWNEKPNIEIVQTDLRAARRAAARAPTARTRGRSPTSTTAPATTAATRSTPARSSANWAGSPPRPSRPASARPCSGTWTTRLGGQRAKRRLPRLGREATTAARDEDPAVRPRRPGGLGAAAQPGAAGRTDGAGFRQHRLPRRLLASRRSSPRPCARCGPT